MPEKCSVCGGDRCMVCDVCHDCFPDTVFTVELGYEALEDEE